MFAGIGAAAVTTLVGRIVAPGPAPTMPNVGVLIGAGVAASALLILADYSPDLAGAAGVLILVAALVRNASPLYAALGRLYTR